MLLLLLIGGIVSGAGERLFNWVIPRGVNFLVAAMIARLALSLAFDTCSRNEASDVLANILAADPENCDFSPIAVALPVLGRCALSQLGRFKRSPIRVWAYKHTNSLGITYYLHSRNVTLRGGRKQTIYYFSKDECRDTAAVLPADLKVEENVRNGLLFLERKSWADAILIPRLLQRAVDSSHVMRSVRIRSALGQAAALPLPTSIRPSDCLLGGSAEAPLERALRSGLSECSKRRGNLPYLTGAVAEAVAARTLDAIGYTAFAKMVVNRGPFRADLLFLSPAGEVLALSAHGTMCEGAIPQTPLGSEIGAGTETSFTAPGWQFNTDDVYGGILAVDLATNTVRIALTADFESYHPVQDYADMASLSAFLRSVE